jgi:hypothetical protein
MTEMTALHRALLELGLEDWIPLPEIAETPEIRGSIDSGQAIADIAAALVELLKQGRIQVWSGCWPGEPRVVGPEVGESMLLDSRRYSFDAEATGLERVYYVNVENFRG